MWYGQAVVWFGSVAYCEVRYGLKKEKVNRNEIGQNMADIRYIINRGRLFS